MNLQFVRTKLVTLKFLTLGFYRVKRNITVRDFVTVLNKTYIVSIIANYIEINNAVINNNSKRKVYVKWQTENPYLNL